MSRITIRIDEQLETREKSELAEAFHRVAEERWGALIESGTSIPWDEATAYVAARARGDRPRKPAARPLKC